MLKKNGGITLIALVVTIIVLLILAGITIAMLTGNNGIITRTNDSKMSQIEGQVQEEIKLAVQSAKIYAMQKSVETTGGGWFASQHIVDGETEKGIKSVMADDIKSPTFTIKGQNIAANAAVATTPATIEVTYTSSDYKAATNYKSADIVAQISVTGNKFELKTFKVGRTVDSSNKTDYKYKIGKQADEVANVSNPTNP